MSTLTLLVLRSTPKLCILSKGKSLFKSYLIFNLESGSSNYSRKIVVYYEDELFLNILLLSNHLHLVFVQNIALYWKIQYIYLGNLNLELELSCITVLWKSPLLTFVLSNLDHSIIFFRLFYGFYNWMSRFSCLCLYVFFNIC